MTGRRIAYVLHGRFPTERAHGVQIAKLCEALGASAEVTVFAPDVGSGEDPAAYYGVQPVFSCVRVAISSILPRASRLGFMLEKIRFLRQAVRQANGFDLIITREPLLMLFARIPVIIEMHDVPAHLRLYVRLLRRARRIVAKTQGMKDVFVRAGIGADQILVLPNAVDVKEYAAGTSQSDRQEQISHPCAVYTGSFQSWKGVTTLIRAGAFVPAITIYIVGGSSDEISFLKRDAPANVLFVGRVSRSDVPRYLETADVLILPNEAGTPLSELYTSPLKLFEYMAARRPIVASALPSIREVLADDEGYFFPAGDQEALAHAIEHILAHPAEAEERATRAYARVSRNTWTSYAAALLEGIV